MGITHTVEAVQPASAAADGLRLVIDSAPALIHTGLPDGYLDFSNCAGKLIMSVFPEENG